jgi:hypothetical protein
MFPQMRTMWDLTAAQREYMLSPDRDEKKVPGAPPTKSEKPAQRRSLAELQKLSDDWHEKKRKALEAKGESNGVVPAPA